MKFFNMDEWSFRKMLKEKRFYEEIEFEDRESKEAITDWIFRLRRYRNIRFEKFMHIFLERYEFTFPIRIKKGIINSRYAKVNITDASGVEYVMRINKKDTRLEEYYILRIGDAKHQVSEKRWGYKLLSPNKNILQEIYEKILDDSEMDIERECIIEYNWESSIITAIAECDDVAVYVNIRAEDMDEEESLMKVLTNINLKEASKNVLSVFNQISEAITEKENIISIHGFLNSNNLSEISLDRDVVVRYSFTKHLELNGELVMQIETPYLKVEEFVRQNHFRL